LFGEFGFDIRYDYAWIVILWTRCEGDEDVAFYCGWENAKQGVVDVFTDQAVCIGVAGVRDDFLGWSESTEYSLDPSWSSRDVSGVPAEVIPEHFCDFDPFPPGNESSDGR